MKKLLHRLFSSGFYIGVGGDIALDGAVLFFKGLDIVSYQYQYLTVYASAFVVGDVSELVEHFFFYSYGYTFNRHTISPK